ncbi:hypothetical protein LC613_07025 [Nostoc sphaeroides CHAB 2801]|uniref:hypothetical protein n=1 Tax=Nostoc sphaeroides TaxID=446679 RepID=UPI000E501C35|nr:hypothetical protein [Nostoc sphaeroides]MCC5627902.1 hypothetical protein [Nostoc sphaeroides CHAB 2801]
MESTLFTTLTVTEEASLSGGKYRRSHKPAKPSTPATPATPAAPAPKPITVTLNLPVIITQVAINVNTGKVGGDLIQTAANQIGEV